MSKKGRPKRKRPRRRRAPRRERCLESNSSTTQRNDVPPNNSSTAQLVEGPPNNDGPRGTTGEASPVQYPAVKRIKTCDSEKSSEDTLIKKILKRKIRADGEDSYNKRKRRRLELLRDDNETPSTSTDTGGESSSNLFISCKSSVEDQSRKGLKRKVSDAGEEPYGKRKRSPEPKDNRPPARPQRRLEIRPEARPEARPETRPETRLETGPRTRPETGPRTRPETGPQTRPETGLQTRPETRPQTGPETKPGTAQETRPGTSVGDARTAFEAKYEQQDQLGEGGFGSVFAGYRRADNLPVAIKHVPKDKQLCKHVDNQGRLISAEVAIMLKLNASTSGSGTSAAVSLLDWYDLDQELILVIERPVPAVDLFEYVLERGGSLHEEDARTIMKQLVDAAKELEDQNIFHRDIKVENILIETGSDVPRVRLIDFGLGCFVQSTSVFRIFYGTSDHVPPEWVTRSIYWAGPATVWQMGVVLYELLHRESFVTGRFLRREPEINERLSAGCQDFLKTCLTKSPEKRPTLAELQGHPWLR